MIACVKKVLSGARGLLNVYLAGEQLLVVFNRATGKKRYGYNDSLNHISFLSQTWKVCAVILPQLERVKLVE